MKKEVKDKMLFYTKHKATYGEFYTKYFETRYIGKIAGKFVGTKGTPKIGYATKEEALIDALRFQILCFKSLILRKDS